MKTFVNVWDALTDDPEEAASMTARSEVMSAISDVVRGWRATQAEAARRLGITQPRLNDLLKGRLDKFSLETLLTLARRAGLTVRLEIGAAA